MQLLNNTQRFGLIAQFLHWIVAVLVAWQFTLAYQAASLPLGVAKLVLVAQHKSVGLTVLLLVIVRLLWRSYNQVPVFPPTMSRWEQRLAHFSHAWLYLVLISLPLSGWWMSSAANFPVSYFGLFRLPDLVRPNKELVAAIKLLHRLLSWSLLVMLVLHVAAALQHHFIRGDDVLRRMVPGGKAASED